MNCGHTEKEAGMEKSERRGDCDVMLRKDEDRSGRSGSRQSEKEEHVCGGGGSFQRASSTAHSSTHTLVMHGSHFVPPAVALSKEYLGGAGGKSWLKPQ
ncbi:hypothetical protein DPEC_G00025290 [Dallia pectoralis]|uniref:Uncharacterized protein n=1 Tax=Dallia pectoralis TaxID=75939 RepID=A0ACC2HHY3_DALPE|nr:hypothetical protein DPEC_G00025290 [Dallia pectoralis]